MTSARDRWLDKLRTSLAEETFAKLTLSMPGPPADQDMRNVYARRVIVRGEAQLSLVWRYATRDVTKNFPVAEALARLAEMLGHDFLRAHLLTTQGDWQWRSDGAGGGTIKGARPALTQVPAAEHDRRKNLPIAPASPFLRALGVTNERGEARPAMADKLRQIERFTELLGHLWSAPSTGNGGALRVLDMGAGKGYLAFAAYEFFRRSVPAVEVVGIEQRAELVESGNRVAKAVGFEGLHFAEGAIDAFPAGKVDVLIALHACDTATDDALHHALKTGAELIIVSPCCHREVRGQMQAPGVLREVLRHGILLEREAEIVTDALRALLLEIHGYKASVMEFIAPEHTGKNLLVVGQRRAHPIDPAPLRAQLRDLMDFYGLRQQHLANLLGER